MDWQEVRGWFAPYFQMSDEPQVWAVQLTLLVLVTVLCNHILLHVLDFLERVTSKTSTTWDSALFHAVRLPLRLLVWVTSLSLAGRLLEAEESSRTIGVLNNVRQLALILIAVLFVTRLIREMEKALTAPPPAGSKKKRGIVTADPATAGAVSKALRLLVFMVAGLVVLETLGLSISGVLAFGGIGGMAVGFAAKDLLANFFGGLMVYTDKPFGVGDWVRSPDKNIEGFVEYIGWRSTRIRTFDKRPLYVPNALFTSIVVETPSRMTHRRIQETLGIRYEDADKMEAICDEVRQALRKHKDIDAHQTLIVNFVSCSASSLDFMVYCYTRATGLVAYHASKQRVLLTIVDIVQRHGAQFAFPTQSLFIEGGGAMRASAPPLRELPLDGEPVALPPGA